MALVFDLIILLTARSYGGQTECNTIGSFYWYPRHF